MGREGSLLPPLRKLGGTSWSSAVGVAENRGDDHRRQTAPPSEVRYEAAGGSFRAKLRTRRREKGESLQDLYRDISRLLQLAYPGEDNKFTQHSGIDSFIALLNDPDVEYEVLKQAPPNLQEAANYAMKLEAYSKSLSTRTTVSVKRGSGQAQSRSRNVFRMTGEPEDSATNEATLLERIGQLEK